MWNVDGLRLEVKLPGDAIDASTAASIIRIAGRNFQEGEQIVN